MGYANKRVGYFEARYKADNGKYLTVLGADAKPIRYPSPEAAKVAADRAELEHQVRVQMGFPGTPSTPPAVPTAADSIATDMAGLRIRPGGDVMFEVYVNGWIEEQDLAETTLDNYESHIQCHLLPTFGSLRLCDISKGTVLTWEKKLRDASYAVESIRTYRALLHVILEDAVEEGRITLNPAKRKRNRGQRTGVDQGQISPKIITDALGAVLIAERMALLSGRDDEFVFEIVKWYTGMRFSELRGLETQFVKDRRIDVQWQIREARGRLKRSRPKFGRTREVHLPDFLWRITSDFITRADRQPCACHGQTYVFNGHGKKQRTGGATLTTIARHLGVSQSAVSRAMQPDGQVSDALRQRVRQAAKELGYFAPADRENADHYHRAGFRESLFTPAVSGVYPKHGTVSAHPVPVSAVPFPGIPFRGRDASKRADGAWGPVAVGMTPHGNRRSHRTNLVELSTPKKLIDARIGHSDPSVQAIYTEVTQVMIDKLMADLTAVWIDSLDQRLVLCGTSQVSILNDLLQARAEELDMHELSIVA